MSDAAGDEDLCICAAEVRNTAHEARLMLPGGECFGSDPAEFESVCGVDDVACEQVGDRDDADSLQQSCSFFSDGRCVDDGAVRFEPERWLRLWFGGMPLHG